MSTVTKIILAVFIIIFIISATFAIKAYVKSRKNTDEFEKISNLITENNSSSEEDVPDYSPLIEKNADFVGWIKVPNTHINHPVVQGTDNAFYLNHNFDKQYDERGSVFMDCNSDALLRSSNTVIHSHNYYDTTMFSELSQYDNIEFYKKTPVFEFNTVEKKYLWKIYAVFITNASESEDNGYVFNYLYPNMDGDNFDGYIEEVNKRRLYITDVDINEDDKMLALSTCARNLDLFKYGRRTYRANTRIVILARAVRAGESAEVNVEKAYVNSNPKYPQLWYDKNQIANPFKNDEKWYPVEVNRDE